MGRLDNKVAIITASAKCPQRPSMQDVFFGDSHVPLERPKFRFKGQ